VIGPECSVSWLARFGDRQRVSDLDVPISA
jgi:hypothetical protein